MSKLTVGFSYTEVCLQNAHKIIEVLSSRSNEFKNFFEVNGTWSDLVCLIKLKGEIKPKNPQNIRIKYGNKRQGNL